MNRIISRKKKVKTIIIATCCCLLQGIFYFDIGYFDDPKYTLIYGSCLVLVISLCCIQKALPNVVWNKVVCLPLVSFALGILIISLIHPVGSGYIVYALDLLLLFPFYYSITYGGGRYKNIYRLLALSAVGEGIIAFFYCLILSFSGRLGIVADRVMGYTTNPNFHGALGLLTFVSGLYLLMVGTKFFAFDIICSISVGIGISFMLTSLCRTALLSSVGCVFAFLIFTIQRFVKEPKKSVNALPIIALSIIVMITTTIGLQMDDINYRAIENRTVMTEQTDSIAEETSAAQPAKETEELQSRLSSQNDANNYSSGRVNIWRIYIDNFSWLGKEVDEIADNFYEGSEWRAHNNFIDYYFRCGYIVGTFYLFFYIAAGICGLKILFNKKRTSAEDFFLVEAIGCYAFYSLVEVATLPFIRCIPCLFFMLAGPIMIKDNSEMRS